MTNIYVGNLSYRATEGDVRSAFSRHGEVASVNLVMDKETGRSRGMAFVEMPNVDEAKAAIEAMHEQEIAGRRVTVNEARPRTERPFRGSSGGGNYGDNRGGGGGRRDEADRSTRGQGGSFGPGGPRRGNDARGRYGN